MHFCQACVSGQLLRQCTGAVGSRGQQPFSQRLFPTQEACLFSRSIQLLIKYLNSETIILKISRKKKILRKCCKTKQTLVIFSVLLKHPKVTGAPKLGSLLLLLLLFPPEIGCYGLNSPQQLVVLDRASGFMIFDESHLVKKEVHKPPRCLTYIYRR